MAKYGRFDPRNKKNGRNKQHSIYKDIRIRSTEEKERRKNWVDKMWPAPVVYDEEDEDVSND